MAKRKIVVRRRHNASTRSRALPRTEYVPHYSGDKSIAFWSRINSARGDLQAQDQAYRLACMLQEMELQVLKALKALQW